MSGKKKLLAALLCALVLCLLCAGAGAIVTSKSGLAGIEDVVYTPHVVYRNDGKFEITMKSGLTGIEDVVYTPHVVHKHDGVIVHTMDEVEKGQIYWETTPGYPVRWYLRLPDPPDSFGRSDFLAWKVVWPDGEYCFGNPGHFISMWDEDDFYADMTIQAIWDAFEDNRLTFQSPQHITIEENAERTQEQLSIAELSMGSADYVKVEFYEGDFVDGANRIHFTVGDSSLNSGATRAIFQIRSIEDKDTLSIFVDENTWSSANAGDYQAALNYSVKFFTDCRASRYTGFPVRTVYGSIPMTLQVGKRITATNDGHGTGTASAAMARNGEIVTLSAEPAEGYRLKEWQVISGGVTVQNDRFVMGDSDVEIKAVFEQVGEVNFLQPGGILLQHAVFAYGEMPEYTGETPAISSNDPHIDYTFTGWSPVLHAVDAPSVNYQAQYQENQYHLMTFSPGDGSGTMATAKIPVSSTHFTLPVCGFTPPEGMSLVGWHVENDETHFSAFYRSTRPKVAVSGDMTAIAEWGPSRVKTAVQPPEGGTVTYDIEAGSFTIEPYPGYKFLGWRYYDEDGLGLDVGYNNRETTYTPTQVQDGTYTAFLEPIDYTVTVSSEGNGNASASVESCNVSNKVTLTADPGEGCRLKEWQTVPDSVEISESNEFMMPADNVTVKAIFVKEYSVNVAASTEAGGTVTGGGNYDENAEVTVTASPNPGYRFVNWTENGTVLSANANVSFSATADRNLTANFIPVYMVTVAAAPEAGGTVTGGGTFDATSSITLTATASEGYHFVSWTEGGEIVGTEPELRITVTADRNLTANFELYTITVTADPPEGGTVSGGGLYASGASATIAAKPNPGYRFLNWTDGAGEVSRDAEYSFTVAADRTLTANFKELPPFDKEHVNFFVPAGSIGANAFAGDEAIAIVDASQCTSLGEHAFRDCRGLTQILLPADCVFPASAFEGCEALVAIYAPGAGKTQASAEAAGIPFMPVE